MADQGIVYPCPDCGASVFDAKHIWTGRPTAIDVKPLASGKVILYEDGFFSIIRGQRVTAPVRYRPHFESCTARVRRHA